MSQTYHLVRSKADGQYLVANLKGKDADAPPRPYLLLFREQFEALTYLNTHGREVADRFATESLASSQLESLIQRWGFAGVGIVNDPLIPTIEFLSRT